MKNVLVTGGTGFIGSNLSAALIERGYSVRAFHRASSDLTAIADLDVEHFHGDLRDPEALRKAVKGCDTVFHVGALVSYWRRQREEMYDINIGGTRNVVESCLEAGVERLVHTSSIAAIGYPGDGSLADETNLFNWDSLDIGYRVSKFRAEGEVLKGVSKGLPAVIVNPAVVIGERDIHFNGGQIVRDVYRKRLFYYLDGGLNVVYVGDVVNGHIQAALKGRVGERYILCGENLTYKEMLSTTAQVVGGIEPLFRLPFWSARGIAWISEIVANATGRKPWVGRELVAGLHIRNWFSCAKAMRELDYSVMPFRTAVQRTFDWYRKHGFL